MKKTIIILISNLLLITACTTHANLIVVVPEVNKEKQAQIIDEYFNKGALKYGLFSRERAEEIDKGLKEDSTIAYLWQQKAMPLFKQGKYEIGMVFLDKAVKYDRDRYQEYRAFMKCIFAKTYKVAIIDFEDCKVRKGNNYVMDHSYDFHIALSYLQLNEFKKAEAIFKKDIEALTAAQGEDWVHHLDLFYYGISVFEQKRYKEAILIFDLALEKYPEFSDVQYYKGICLNNIGEYEQAKALFSESKRNCKIGYTINEDNVAYEKYPYQMKW